MRPHLLMPLVVFTVLISTSVRADKDVHSNDEECGRLRGMLEINLCAGEKFHEADSELNALYAEKLNLTKTKASKNRLRNAQRAWIAFRDTACLYEARPEKESGSIWAFHQFGCMEFYTRMRIEDFKLYLRCTTDDCP